MTTTQIQSRLSNLGATAYEAGLLSEIMWLNGGFDWPAFKPSARERDDMTVWLEDFRSERALMAANNAASRKATLEAGYLVRPCNHLNQFKSTFVATKCLSCGDGIAA